VPSFDGDYKKWTLFRDTFSSLVISNGSLGKTQKYHYLVSLLQGEAKQLIANLTISEDNFNHSWDLIVARYTRNNPKIIRANHAKSLFNLPHVAKEDASQYRKLVNGVTSNVNAIRNLALGIPLHEMLLTEAILSRLRPQVGHDWDIKTSDTNVNDLNSLINFIEVRCQALELCDFRSTSNGKNKVGYVKFDRPANRNSLVTSLPSDSCSYCSSVHSIAKCKTFIRRFL
jgi:hypothetical protein